MFMVKNAKDMALLWLFLTDATLFIYSATQKRCGIQQQSLLHTSSSNT